MCELVLQSTRRVDLHHVDMQEHVGCFLSLCILAGIRRLRGTSTVSAWGEAELPQPGRLDTPSMQNRCISIPLGGELQTNDFSFIQNRVGAEDKQVKMLWRRLVFVRDTPGLLQ